MRCEKIINVIYAIIVVLHKIEPQKLLPYVAFLRCYYTFVYKSVTRKIQGGAAQSVYEELLRGDFCYIKCVAIYVTGEGAEKVAAVFGFKDKAVGYIGVLENGYHVVSLYVYFFCCAGFSSALSPFSSC